MLKSSTWPKDRTISGATTPDQSEPESDVNEREHRIPQSSSITEATLLDCLVSYPGHSLGDFTPVQRCSRCIQQPLLTGSHSGSEWTWDYWQLKGTPYFQNLKEWNHTIICFSAISRTFGVVVDLIIFQRFSCLILPLLSSRLRQFVFSRIKCV